MCLEARIILANQHPPLSSERQSEGRSARMNPKLSSTRAVRARFPKRRSYGRRRGYVLVLVIMLLFGILGLAALVIDIGFARLAQSEMQTAADSAALEGLRNGRQQAGQIVSEMFSDSTDSSGQTVQYGAGPVVDFSGGVGDPDLAAAQLMQPGNPPVYQPMTSTGTAGLELNLTNATEGDMASGTYGVNSTYDPTLTADEDANYNRRDFVPSLSGTSAFLVRMRRSNNYNGLDREAGISSAGPTLPFLFGRGSMMARSGGVTQLSASSGITVRATAIAGPQPAKSVGPAYSTTAGTLTAQLAPFALRSDLWAEVSAGTSGVTLTLPDPRVLLLAPTSSTSLTSIGQQLVTATANSLPSSGPLYVPVYADYASQAATIVGFVFNRWSYSNVSLTLGPPVPTQIGTQNVSPTMALPLPAALAQADVTSLFQAHAALISPLYAPALVNRYLGPFPP